VAMEAETAAAMAVAMEAETAVEKAVSNGRSN